MRRERFNNPFAAIGFYLFIILFVVMTLAPLFWVFRMSVIPAADCFGLPVGSSGRASTRRASAISP